MEQAEQLRGRNYLLAWLVLIILAVIWGSSFILMKWGLIAFSYSQVASLRIVISFLSLAPFAVIYLRRLPLKQSVPVFFVGLLGSGIPPYLFTHAQLVVDSMVAGILNALTSLFTLVVGVIFFSARTTRLKIAGVLLGLMGAALLIWSQDERTTLQTGSAMLIVLATVMYGFSVNILKTHLQDHDSLMVTTLAFCLLGPPAMGVLFSTDFIQVMKTHPAAWESLGYISILAVVGTAASTVVYFRLVQMTSALFGSTVTFLIPVVAVLWGVADGEKLSGAIIAGMVIILAGVYLTNRPK